MPPVKCIGIDCDNAAVLKRPKTGDTLCKECFFFAFESEIHWTIVKGKLFKKGDRVAIGASGGKDSTVLAYILKLLNDRYDYGLDLFLLSIDEGISGYRDDSLETVKQNRDDYQLPLKILSYKDLYGWTMDEIVAQIGKKNNCTFCGVFRRQALDRGAALVGADMIATGHNADDVAETVIMNVLRGDLARLLRCTNIITEGEGTIPRCKPLKYAYEKEIVMYAHYKELVYFSTECLYAPNAYRGHTREYIKEVERIRPSCILDIIHSGETMEVEKSIKFPKRQTCSRCGFVASQEICKACVLLEGLNSGIPKLGIGKSNRAKKFLGLHVPDGSENKLKKPPVDEAKRESKRKMRREKKRLYLSGKGSLTSKNRQKSTNDVDMSDSFLLPSESNPEDKQICGGSSSCLNYSGSKCTLQDCHNKETVSEDSNAYSEVKASKCEMKGCDGEGACGSSSNSSESKISKFKSEDYETEGACGGSTNYSVSSTNILFSSDDDDEAFLEPKEKNDFVECRCPARLRAIGEQSKKIQSNDSDNDLEDNSHSVSDTISNDSLDEDGFDIELFKYLVLKDKPELWKETMMPSTYAKLKTICLENESVTSASSSSGKKDGDSKSSPEPLSFEDKLASLSLQESEDLHQQILSLLQSGNSTSSLTMEKTKKSASLLEESEDLEQQILSLLQPGNSSSSLIMKKTEKSASLSLQESEDLDQQILSVLQPGNSTSSLTMKKTEESASEEINVSELSVIKKSEPSISSTTENLSDEQPNVVKATPKKKGPSLMLPEMMYKAKNNLEF